MNLALIHEMIAAGMIRVNKHPEQDLYIYNYTQMAQYESCWNEATLLCRGLILDENYKIVARPFPKFFNLGERVEELIPNEPFEVYEKMDGSLGVLYWAGNTPYIASRGSFASEQSVFATQLLHTRYRHVWEKLSPAHTYLFEIIYPENRIVVDYGDLEELILLGIIETSTGEELDLQDLGFPIVPRYDGLKDIALLKSLEENNKEGFVVKFKSGYRVKVKFEEYKRIHRIVTQVSSISIWENLREGLDFAHLLERVPDEFFNWVREVCAKLHEEYAAIETQAKADFKVLEDRKTTALYFQSCKYPGILFAMLDGKNYRDAIWKMIRPKYEKAFASDEE